MTCAAYLAAEELSETKHEYLRGEVYDRPTSPPEHAALTAAVMSELSLALRNRTVSRVWTGSAGAQRGG